MSFLSKVKSIALAPVRAIAYIILAIKGSD